MPDDAGVGLVPGRRCGGCTVCCKELTIDTDALRKVQGVTCVHCIPSGGCTIYPRWPAICRDWYCLWRHYAWLDDSWRPDRCQILLRATDDDVPAGYAAGPGVVVDILGPSDVLLRYEVVMVIVRLVAADVATFLSVPGLPGYASGRVLLNPSLLVPLHDGDGDTLRRRLVEAFLRSALHPKVAIELEAVWPER
ncbi:MAG TPA: hypothetical protein VMU81_07335 [Acetobacteraceae bacterium]|nr:hypothetical protein [Acetobacteraceae bacterium]